jgi:hypothetical protein
MESGLNLKDVPAFYLGSYGTNTGHYLEPLHSITIHLQFVFWGFPLVMLRMPTKTLSSNATCMNWLFHRPFHRPFYVLRMSWSICFLMDSINVTFMLICYGNILDAGNRMYEQKCPLLCATHGSFWEAVRVLKAVTMEAQGSEGS